MQHYCKNGWQSIFVANNLADFNALWNIKADWFEPPNVCRGGWSGVVKIAVATPKGTGNLFLKRQQNHLSKTVRYPFGIATLHKEFANIKRLNNKKIPTLELIYFARKGRQAILITQELTDYLPLDSAQFYCLPHSQKQALLVKTAQTCALMHQHNLQHGCLYPKHIFAKKSNSLWYVKLIDLEKLRRTLLSKSAVIKDLSALHRRSDKNWTLKDRVCFFKAYVNESKLSQKSKNIWRALAKKVQAKSQRTN